MAAQVDNCPKCNTSFMGDPIPKDIVKNYSCTHWRKEIGIDGGYMGIYDGIIAFRCPDCNFEFPAGKDPFYLEVFKKYLKIKKENL